MVLSSGNSDKDDDEDFVDENVSSGEVDISTRVTHSRSWTPLLLSNAIIKRRQELIKKSKLVHGNLGEHGWTILEKFGNNLMHLLLRDHRQKY